MDGDGKVRVRERAYEIWLQSGRPEGAAESHWLQAEREVSGTAARPGTPVRKSAAKSSGAVAVKKAAAAAPREAAGSKRAAGKAKGKGAASAPPKGRTTPAQDVTAR